MKKMILLFSAIVVFVGLYAQKDPYLLQTIKEKEGVNCVEFSPDGLSILAGFDDGSAAVINLASGKEEVKVNGHWKGVNAVGFDPKGRYFMTAGENTIKIWTPDGQEIYSLNNHTTTIITADIDKTGEYMVSGAVFRMFKQWNVIKGELIRNFDGHTDVAMAVCYSPDGERIASGSGDHTIKIWDAQSGKELMSMPGHSSDIYGVEFSPDGKLLASCGKDKTIHLYDLSRGKLIRSFAGHKNYIVDIAFSPDGLHLLSASLDQEIRYWEVATGKTIYSFIDHEAPVTGIAFSPDGSKFASSSQDKTIRIWQLPKEIIVDFYYSSEIIGKMNTMEIFRPRQKGESGSDYRARQQKAEQVKAELYEAFYRRYLEDLKNGALPGS